MSEQPVAVVCVGMAGSGKTTFMQRINSHLHGKKTIPYVLNLDPAVRHVPFSPNIDIRDSVNYKEVMKQYNLGPNGGILTSLNLFATKIDQILALLEKRTKPTEATPDQPASAAVQNILIDTPGQIEVFVWSASGAILLDSLASSFPTVLAYIIDTPRSASTSTFMSNMLYACSILYKTKLPMILVMNKADIKDPSFAKEWMTDFDVFQKALREEEEGGSFGGVDGGAGAAGGGSGYMGSLLNSMSLVLEEFYNHLSMVGVSAMTGQGIDEFFAAVQEKKEEYLRDYRPELERKRDERQKETRDKRSREVERLMRDMDMGDGGEKKQKQKQNQKQKNLGTSIDTGSGPAKPSGRAGIASLSDYETDEDEDDVRHPDDDDDYDNDDDDDDDDENREDDTEGREDDDGLQARYRNELRREDGGSSALEDQSFARYLKQSNIK